MNRQPKYGNEGTSVPDDIRHDNLMNQTIPDPIETLPKSTGDFAVEFTESEKSTATQTIIQYLIQIYGYEATRTEFLVPMFNRTYSNAQKFSEPVRGHTCANGMPLE